MNIMGSRNVLKKKIKGQKFFKSKFINDFLFESDNLPNVCITAKVRAEMKKTSYDVTLTISSNNVVLFLHIVTDKKKNVKIIFIIIRLYGDMWICFPPSDDYYALEPRVADKF